MLVPKRVHRLQEGTVEQLLLVRTAVGIQAAALAAAQLLPAAAAALVALLLFQSVHRVLQGAVLLQQRPEWK
jgi:hypothetical protein